MSNKGERWKVLAEWHDWLYWSLSLYFDKPTAVLGVSSRALLKKRNRTPEAGVWVWAPSKTAAKKMGREVSRAGSVLSSPLSPQGGLWVRVLLQSKSHHCWAPGDLSRLEEEWSASLLVSYPSFEEQARQQKISDQHEAPGLLSPT